MKLTDTLRDISGLPAYWRHSRHVRRAMTAPLRRIPYGPHPRQYYLQLSPASPSDRYAFYFHGGGWTFGTPEAFRPAARTWLAHGFNVILPSYRRPPTFGIDDIVADCRTAIASVATHHAGGPLATPQLGGISAGGHLAALTALYPHWWTDRGWPAPPDRALLCAAPLDLRILRPRRLLAFTRAHNPIEQLAPAPDVRWFLLHGTRDGMVDHRHSIRFADALEANTPHQLRLIPHGGHLDAGRWTYDDGNPYAAAIAAFIL